ALPGGIILALGRRSKLPVVRVLSTSFIELFRSVPLITVLFMATTMFPLFMPEGFVLNKLVQVIIAVCLFNACYIAEIVRGGLQTIPKGQFEGAHTVGLGYWQTMGLVIMPQALKHMIPNIVGNFIGLLKDTTLVSIIGLFDVLGMLRSISKDLPWLGLHKEPLVFGAIMFFLICFAMSKYSRHLEAKLSTGHSN
ncbi:MAG: amino acid ABC transporter permease, partial [Gammaproteobacteria bacterium]